MDLSQRFAQNLSRLRREAGLTQEQLAARASLHRTEISLLERGQRRPLIDTLTRLAGALSLDPGALLEGIAWVPSPGGGRFVIADRH